MDSHGNLREGTNTRVDLEELRAIMKSSKGVVEGLLHDTSTRVRSVDSAIARHDDEDQMVGRSASESHAYAHSITDVTGAQNCKTIRVLPIPSVVVGDSGAGRSSKNPHHAFSGPITNPNTGSFAADLGDSIHQVYTTVSEYPNLVRTPNVPGNDSRVFETGVNYKFIAHEYTNTFSGIGDGDNIRVSTINPKYMSDPSIPTTKMSVYTNPGENVNDNTTNPSVGMVSSMQDTSMVSSQLVGNNTTYPTDISDDLQLGKYAIWPLLSKDKGQEITDIVCNMYALLSESACKPKGTLIVYDNPLVSSSEPIVQSTSYAGVTGGSTKVQPNVTSNIRPLMTEPVFDGVNISIPRKVIKKVSTHFEHTLYGYFIGKRMAFLVVEYNARNNWVPYVTSRSSFERCLIEVNSEADLVDVVTIGIPSLTGDDFTKETIRVEYKPKAPTSAPKKGATNVSKPSKSSSMLKTTDTSPKKDNFTMSNSFSALNDEEEDDDEVENVYDESTNLFPNRKTGGSPSFTAAAAPLCYECRVFGHNVDLCPKRVVDIAKVNVEDKDDGFTTVTNRKKKAKQPQARKIEGVKINKPKATFVYHPKNFKPARTMETESEDIDLFKLKNQFDSLRD
ncbi:hypothetical protein Tco_0151077 [Tanacetum coccineum]